MTDPNTLATGQTLREWRAGLAMSGLLAAEGENLLTARVTVPQLVTLAYACADGLDVSAVWDQDEWDVGYWG